MDISCRGSGWPCSNRGVSRVVTVSIAIACRSTKGLHYAHDRVTTACLILTFWRRKKTFFVFGPGGARQKMYAMGGWDGANRLSSMECFDPSTGQRIVMPAAMSTTWFVFAACALYNTTSSYVSLLRLVFYL